MALRKLTIELVYDDKNPEVILLHKTSVEEFEDVVIELEKKDFNHGF